MSSLPSDQRRQLERTVKEARRDAAMALRAKLAAILEGEERRLSTSSCAGSRCMNSRWAGIQIWMTACE